MPFNWKYNLTLIAIIIILVIYIKHKLTFWSKQFIPNDLFLFNSYFSSTINEMDQKNTKKLGKVFG